MDARMAVVTAIIFVSLLAVSTAGRGKCPSRCKCSASGTSYTVDCSNLVMKRLPRNLPDTTTDLNFSGNQLTELSEHAFRGLEELRHLRISRNVISYVDKSAFSQLLKLEDIDIRGNTITSLAAETFKNQRKLKRIDLSYNKISSMDTIFHSFVHLSFLESLSLTGNPLRSLPANSFSELDRLRELYLSHCPLGSLSDEAFVGLLGLDTLGVSYTQLTEFPTSALSHLRLRELDISHNRIRHIDQMALNVVRRMEGRELKWEGNPLYCDCNALPLWNHLNNLGSDHSPITCFAPADVTGMDLYYVQKFHLRCGMDEIPRFVRQPFDTSVHLDGVAVLVCQADGNPDPGISWLKDGAPLATNHCGMKYSKTCTGSLVIHDVNSDDTGEYSCVIKDGLHRVISKPASLSIVKPCYGSKQNGNRSRPSDDTDDDDDSDPQTSGSGDGDGADPTHDGVGRILGVVCSDPGIPENSRRFVRHQELNETGSFRVNAVIRYGCIRYYELEGEPSLWCQADGTWNASLPICKPACGQKDITDPEYLTRVRRYLPIISTAMEAVPRIYNGHVSLKGEWPWLGLLIISYQSCGVSLVSRSWAVTAAHCVVEGQDKVKAKSSMRVYFGRHQSSQEEAGQQGRGIRNILIHPQYAVANNFDYDIALIEFEAPIDISQNVRPVCLPPPSTSPNSDYDRAHSIGVVTGWGKTSNDRSAGAARLLHKGHVEIADQTDCIGVMKQIGNVTDRMICAGVYSDTCQGDSGGPLVTTYKNRWYLAGVTSWGPRTCGSRDYYGVYVRVTNHEILNWIHGNVNSKTVTSGGS